MPSLSVSPVTLPKRVSTPTCPVGTEVMLENSRINSSPATMIDKNRPFRLLKPGILLREPSKSKPPRPVVVMNFLRPKLGRTECFQVAAIILRRREERNLGGASKSAD